MIICTRERGHDDEDRSKKDWQMETHLVSLFEGSLAFGHEHGLLFSLPVGLVHAVAVRHLQQVVGLDGVDTERDRNGAHLKGKK
jgi:hypothetical protein